MAAHPCTALLKSLLHCIVLINTAHHYTALLNTVDHCTALLNIVHHCTALQKTVHRCTELLNTVDHCTALFNNILQSVLTCPNKSLHSGQCQGQVLLPLPSPLPGFSQGRDGISNNKRCPRETLQYLFARLALLSHIQETGSVSSFNIQ